MKKFVVTAIATIGMTVTLFQGPAYAGQCYWDSNGVLVVPEDGQCTIMLDEPAQNVPNSAPSSQPMPSNSPSPTPTTPLPAPLNPTPATIKPSEMRTIRVENYKSHILGEKVLKIAITNLDNPSESVSCFVATSCELKVPHGTRYRATILSSEAFAVIGSNFEGWTGTYLFGTPIATHEGTATEDVVHTYLFWVLVQDLLITGTQNHLLEFNYEREGGRESDEGGSTFFLSTPLTYFEGDDITVREVWQNDRHIQWTGLPEGLRALEGGGFGGKLIKPGKYKIEGRIGDSLSNFYLRMELEIKPTLLPPLVISTLPQDSTTQILNIKPAELNGKAFIANFFKIVLLNTSTGKSVERFYDGAATSGTLPFLNPGTKYRGYIWSCRASDGLCSNSATEFDFTTGKAPYTVSSKKGNVDTQVKSSWIDGTRNGLNVSIAAPVGKTVTLTTGLKPSKKEREAFKAATGWQISDKGVITLVMGSKSKKLKEVALRGLFINFTASPKAK